MNLPHIFTSNLTTTMKKILSLAAILLSLSFAALAQKNYNTEIGVQLGSPTGFHIKHYLSSKNSIEAVIGGNSSRGDYYNNNGWNDNYYTRAIYAQFHYEWNYKFFDVKEMNWYWGIGGYVGMYSRPEWTYGGYNRNGKYYNSGHWEQRTSAFAGVSGIFGVEYTMKDYPFSFGANITPGVSILPDVNPFGTYLTPWGGVHANYTFK